MELHENRAMCQYLCERQLLKTKEVIEAFNQVDRGDFVPAQLKREIYKNRPVRLNKVHMSAPFIYARAAEELKLKPGTSFLNIGSGTGYFSYVVSILVGKSGLNHGIEIEQDMVDYSKNMVEACDRKLKRATRIQFVTGNGLRLDPRLERYDAIYVGAGCSYILNNSYLRSLLNRGGRLVAPFGQTLVLIRRKNDESTQVVALCPASFKPIIQPSRSWFQLKNFTERNIRPSFALQPWSPSVHKLYPLQFQKIVYTCLVIKDKKKSVSSSVPLYIWFEILSYLQRDWFTRKPSMINFARFKPTWLRETLKW